MLLLKFRGTGVGMEAIEGLRFLASLPLAVTGRTKRRENATFQLLPLPSVYKSTTATGCPIWFETLVGLTLILGVPLSVHFCWGRWEFA